MLRKVVSLFVIFVFLLTEITVDFYYLKNIRFSVARVYADTATPYCLPTNDGTKTGTFSQEMGYCVLDPEDPMGKCLSPYVYSTEYKKCITVPLCPGLYVWNSQTKQCESVSASPSGDTEPIFPDNSCAVDSNGDGEVQQNEIHQCQQTPQGYICPVGQAQCNPQYQQPSCPEQYTYNPQTQKCEYTPQVGVCFSQQVPVTQYQCPVNGQVYSNLNQCNSACIQTAQCNLTQVTPVVTGSIINYCHDCRIYFYANGNKINVYYRNGTYLGSLTLTNVTASGGVGSPYIYYGNNGDSYTARYYDKSGNFLGSITFSLPISHWIGSNERNYVTGIQGSGNRIIYYHCHDICWESGRTIIQPQSVYTCPLPGGSSCTGNPPTCTKGQACVTYDSTVTKWQCSLNGTQYDTQEQCTTSCYSGCPSGGIFNPTTGKCEATATCQTGTLQAEGCFTGYGCPLGQYQCQNVNGTWMCSPYQCITSSQLQDEGDVIPSGYDDDGPRDEQGNCLGTIYIFNGKGMRCRKSGVQTGFHNCCNESQGKLYDSTGSTGGGLGAIKNIAEILYGVYSAINVGQIASQLATNGASSIAITMQNGVVTRVVIPGYGTVTGQQAQSLVNGLMQNGNLQYLGQSGNEVFARVISGGADTATAGTMSDFLKNSGIANSVVSLATSMLIQDPVLSSAVNVAAQSVLWAFGYTSPLGLATAVIGLAMNLFMKRCDKQDIITSTFKESGYCHEVGEYCIKKWPLVGCVQKAKGFCCFNSKLARIIHEQGRPQLVGFGINSWGSPKNPNCRGFLPEEFQALDFNKIDLSEYIQDIQRNIRQNLAPQLQQQIQQSWGQ